jgi:glycosyltransferase involved in cell wall biosynthesis
MNHDLIVFGEDWGGLPSSTQHLINHLAKTHKIVWINSIGLRRPAFSWQDVRRAWGKLTAKRSLGESKSTASSGNGFHILNPRTLPAPRSRLERWIASRLLKSQIIPVLKKAKLNSPVLWTSLPTAVDMCGHLGESAVIYYCGDDFSALAGVDHKTVNAREQELISKADLILAASEKLANRFPSTTTRLLPHGVDYELFSQPAKRAHDLPNNGKPVAGFYGSISEWLDIDLLHSTIARLPDWHFVFIGKTVIDMSRLSQFDNVSLLGEKPHHELPSYSQHWTASLLPFIDNPQIQACNPLKLREYLAAGRPIISTDFPALSDYHDLVHTVSDSDSMIRALQKAKSEPTDNHKRLAVAEQTWSARAEQVSDWIERI